MWSGLISIAPIQFIDALRLTFGPLPDWLCWFQSFWRNCPLVGSMIFFDAIFILRYVFIFIFKSVPPINEDLIARVIYLSVSIWCFLYGLTFMALPGKMALNYYMCSGEDPAVDFYSYNKVPINSLVPFVSMIIYLVLSVKIGRHRWQMARKFQIQTSLIDSSVSYAASSEVTVTTDTNPRPRASREFNECFHKAMLTKSSVSFAAIMVRINYLEFILTTYLSSKF